MCKFHDSTTFHWLHQRILCQKIHQKHVWNFQIEPLVTEKSFFYHPSLLLFKRFPSKSPSRRVLCRTALVGSANQNAGFQDIVISFYLDRMRDLNRLFRHEIQRDHFHRNYILKWSCTICFYPHFNRNTK